MELLRISIYLFSFLSSLCFVSALDDQSIIHKIKSDTYCRPYGDNAGPLHTFDLDEVPQFGAMCNVPPPNVDQLKFLLENNVTPILCMGLYDVLQRYCKSVTKIPRPKHIPLLKEKFPLTVDGTNTLFDSFDKLDSFSSLHNFCSSTVKNSTITQSASVDTELWWNALNGQIRSEDTCLRMCRTYEDNKVHPLCSYIIWFNSLYLNSEQDLNDPRPKFGGTDENLESSPSKPNLNKTVAIETNQILPSETQNQSIFSSTVSTVFSSSTTLQQSGQPAPQEEVPFLEANKTDELQVVFPSSRSQQTISTNANGQDPITSKIAPLKISHKVTSDSKLKNETSFNHEPVLINTKVDKAKEKEPHVKTESEYKPSKPPKLYDMNVKIEDGYSTPVVTKPVDIRKKTPEKHTEGMVESDFTLEMTPDGMEMEQPSLADKDLQQPYSDEESENGDGDDIDFQPEDSAKLAQNKTIQNKSKSSSVNVDQGINDPDKAYGEEREILIEDHFIEAEDSHFFTYFLCMAVLTIMAYLVFHNKKKLLALALEGKRTRSSRRRPNSSNYSKLDCSLEEAMASGTTPASVTHVLY